MKQMRSVAAVTRAVVLLTIPLFACGEKSEKAPNAPQPVVSQPVAPAVTQAPAAPLISPDADLESQLKKALAGDPVLGAFAIDVKVVDGVARIWGTVRTRSDLRKVTALVKANDRVKSVESNLVVVAGS